MVDNALGDRAEWLALDAGERAARVRALQSRVIARLSAAVPSLDVSEGGPAQALCRGLVAAELGRLLDGFVREEQLAALESEVDQVVASHPEVGPGVVLGAGREAGLRALVDALKDWHRATTGVRGVLDRLGRRADTLFDNLSHGALYVASGAPEHEGRYVDGVWSNWTEAYRVRPQRFVQPSDESAICAAVAEARSLRVVAGGHSFNDTPLCDDTLLSLDAYDRVLALDPAARTARVQAGIRLRDLNRALWAAGLALPVLGSTDAQSIGGLVATDLHGTGRDNGFLSEQVRSLRIVGADGVARTVCPGDPLFHAAFGGIGACGVVIEVELDLEPAFHLAKATAMVDRVRTEEGLDTLLQDNGHVSFYYVGGGDEIDAVRVHRWNRTTDPLTADWQRQKARAELSDFALSAFIPGLAEVVAELDADAWFSDAVAPDTTLVMPACNGFGRALFYRHDEIEFGVPYANHQACLAEIVELLRREDAFSVIEVRYTPDTSRSLIGPGAGGRTAYIELATPLSQPTARLYAAAERILAAHGGKPHLGKKTQFTARDMEAAHGSRFNEFQAVRHAQDPPGKFLNAFAARVFGAV